MRVPKETYQAIIEKIKNVFELRETEVRVTDYTLFIKNPTYPVCDVLMLPGRAYNIEYVLNYWVSVLSKTIDVYFCLKHTGIHVSLSCFLAHKKRGSSMVQKLQPLNFLNINDSIEISLEGIENLKPSRENLLTKCTVQRSHHPNIYVVEFIVYGPENDAFFKELMRDINIRMKKTSRLTSRPTKPRKEVVETSGQVPRWSRTHVILSALCFFLLLALLLK